MSTLDVLQLLRDLGSDADVVAQSLRAKGIQGRKRVGCECPIAHYLLHQGVPQPIIAPDKVVYGPEEATVADEVLLPEAVKDFVFAFDLDCYPDLILSK